MSKVTLEQLGTIVKEQRGNRGLRECAREIGVAAATLSRVESEKQPDLETFSKLCHWLKIDPGEVLGFEPGGISAASDTDLFAETTLAHFRADRELTPETAVHLGKLIVAVQRSATRMLESK